MLEAQTPGVYLQEVVSRLSIAPDRVVSPVNMQWLLNVAEPNQGEWNDIRQFAQGLHTRSSIFLVLWAPNHFTSLEVAMDPRGQPQLRFFDSILGGHTPSREAASRLLARLCPDNTPALPDSSCPPGWAQTDGWSYGLHVLQHLDRALRAQLGEPPVPLLSLRQLIKRGSDFQAKVRAVPKPEKLPAVTGEPSTGEPSKIEDPSLLDLHREASLVVAAAAEGPLPSKPGAPATLEEALAPARACKKCWPRVGKRSFGQKGCRKCMRDFFDMF